MFIMKLVNMEGDEMVKSSFSIHEVAHILNIPVSTLRFWEKKGLIKPDRNLQNGYREYSPEAVVDISDIVSYRNLKFSIQELSGLPGMTVSELENMMLCAQGRLEEDIHHLQQIQAELSQRQSLLGEYYHLLKHSFAFAVFGGKKIIASNKFTGKNMKMVLLSTKFSYSFLTLRENWSGHIHTIIADVETPLPIEAQILMTTAPEERFLEFLISTESPNYHKHNDLPKSLRRIVEMGYEPEYVISKFLFNAFDPQTGKRMDYYHGYAKV